MRLKVLIFAIVLPLVGAAVAQPSQAGFGGGDRSVRGTVTAAAPPFFTIRTDTDETWQVKLGPNARVIKSSGAMPGEHRGNQRDQNQRDQNQSDPNQSDQQTPPESISVADIHVGDILAAGGDIDASAKKVNAAFGFVIDAATVKQLAADWAVTYIAGKITALDADQAKITVQRPDGKTATIQADENTSFRKRRESITLADIKVGDRVTGRGALKNGVFTPVALVVFDANARRGERNAGNGAVPPQLPPSR